MPRLTDDDLALVIGLSVWTQIGDDLRRLDPHRYVAVLKEAQRIVGIHKGADEELERIKRDNEEADRREYAAMIERSTERAKPATPKRRKPPVRRRRRAPKLRLVDGGAA